MIKGLVVKVKKDYSILLSEGKFYKIKNKGPMKEGQKIMVSMEDVMMDKGNISNKKSKYIAIAVAAALMITLAFSSLNFGNKAYAVATIDINPSVELKLDKDYKVIKMDALNKDGESLMDLKVKKMKIEDAIELIVKEAEEKGFIKEGENPYVLVTTIVIDKKSQSKEEQELTNNNIKNGIQSKTEKSEILKSVNIAINNTSKEIYEDLIGFYRGKDKENQVPIGVIIANDKIDRKSFKSLKDFFDDDDNIKLFKKDGTIILNARDKLNKLVDELVKLEKENKLGIDIEDLLEKANDLSKKDSKDVKGLFDAMEDLVDEIEDAIDDIEDYDDDDDFDKDDDDNFDKDDDDDDDDDE